MGRRDSAGLANWASESLWPDHFAWAFYALIMYQIVMLIPILNPSPGGVEFYLVFNTEPDNDEQCREQ